MSEPQQQNPLADLPPVSKALAGGTLLIHLVTLASPAVFTSLALIPTTFYSKIYLWTPATTILVHATFLGALFDAIFLLFAGKVFEPLWGAKNFVRFLLLNNLIGATAALFAISLLNAMFGAPRMMLTPVDGASGAIAALLVATASLYPDQELQLFFALKLKARWVPHLFLGISTVFALLFGVWNAWLMTAFGCVSGFVYMNYDEVKEAIMKRLGRSKDRVPSGRVLGGSSAAGAGVAAGAASSELDAERRRALAVKALEERMALLRNTEDDEEEFVDDEV